MAIHIRRAKNIDATALIELDHVCFTQDQFSERQWHYLLKSPTTLIWVITENDFQILGAAVILIRKTSRNARLYSFAIHPDARKKSYAKQLHQRIIEDLKTFHFQKMTLEVRENNNIAQHFYESIGYKKTGTILNYYPDGIDAVKMQLDLTTPAQ